MHSITGIENCDCKRCFQEVSRKMHTLMCLNNNLQLLSDGLALSENNQASNALMFTAEIMERELRELSEYLEYIESDYSDNICKPANVVKE
ncbi:hypothetical protein [Butyrivibrio sp. AD3002]|uniref:hypothetical protein n=1 Tax=Butyrivibrio sp. AD3002 TaxID=1280670 RepID=UPI0003B40A91|nr:hypothetical protein [Butyrivibrio sp. AD3002]